MSETMAAQSAGMNGTAGNPEATGSVTFGGLDEIAFEGAGDALFKIELDGLPFAFRIRRRPKSARLLVVLSGAVHRGGSPPSFGHFRAYASLTKINVLAISDPTLLLVPNMRVSCFLGERDRDPITGVTRLTEAVARVLGVPPHGVIYSGHSGGGFAALMAAIRSNGRGMALNPQLDLGDVPRTPLSARVATAFESGKAIRALRAEYPTRSSVLEALKEAHANGMRPKLAIAQNTDDVMHHLLQYEPFRRRLAEDEALAGAGGIYMTTFEHSSGHYKPPRAVMQQLLPGAFAHCGFASALKRARGALSTAQQIEAA